MKLSTIIQTVKAININGSAKIKTGINADTEIGSIHYRSQDVKPGGLFVAIKGHATDGHDYIDEALARGATAIIVQEPIEKDSTVIRVANTRKALAVVAARFFGNPSEHLCITGITGTNGKTTTAFLTESIFAQAGFKVGVIGTLNYRYAGKTFKNSLTTPESLDLQTILAQMLKHGITHVLMEVSSHAIDLFRIDSCWLDVGVFTNLTQDHLDYHKDMDSYWACKQKLFTEHLKSGPKKDRAVAVVNCDDARGKELFEGLSSDNISIGHLNNNMIWTPAITNTSAGITGRISTPGGAFDFKSPLVGKHNVENILCATGIGTAHKVPLETIKTGIEEVRRIPGRLEAIPNRVKRFVYVDYAHTPDALENVLSSLTASASGRMICVFGCGGDRDKDKRSQMGEVAEKLCDLVVITSDNPRTEDPMEIIDQIINGIKKLSFYQYDPSELKTGFQKRGYVIEPDRRQAIHLGIKASQPGDTILIAGKGDETYQIIRGTTVPFDDRQEAKIALSV